MRVQKSYDIPAPLLAPQRPRRIRFHARRTSNGVGRRPRMTKAIARADATHQNPALFITHQPHG
jgi:hypothetical protein